YPAGSPTIPTQILGQSVLQHDAQNSNISTKSLPVASYVKNIEDDNWTKNYTWYDTKGRAIGSHSINHLGGYTKTESELDFSGTPKMAITKHKRLDSDTERVITENFTYDHQNRLLTHTHQVDNNPVEYLAQNKYNELSQLEYKKVGGTSLNSPLQKVDYKYNIRGWMTQINNPADLRGGDLFGYKIKYNQVDGQQIPNSDFTNLQVKPKYNGNIVEIDWKTNTTTGDNLRRYGYVYDGLNRLLAGFYQKDTNPTAKEYFEKMDYDLNGNITNLKRSEGILNGSGTAMTIDNLNYIYTGNRLNSVTDISGQYSGYPDTSGNTISYDLNGNMKDHKDKGILQIDYNFLNLPKFLKFDQLYFTRGTWLNTNTTNYYKADGSKIRKEHRYSENSSYKLKTTEYLDGFQYEIKSISASTAPLLKFIPTSEGYFNFENNKYIYNYSDHLGNVRLSYMHNGSSIEVLEESNYYPFGLKHEGYNALAGNPSYNYKFLGEELQETGFYDLNARFYMPDIAIFGQHDPLSEKTMQPYAYGYNNPIRYGDPTGLSGNDFVQRKDGSIYWDNKANNQATTKAGDTYLGKNLSLTFNSYIADNYDGAMGSLPEGDKLTTTINLSATENSAGELTGLSATKTTEIGKTFGLFEGRDYYPGEGGSNNYFTKSGMSINYEQHASVPNSFPAYEEAGLNAMGFKIVDVAQKLNISFDKKSGNLSVNAYTNIFPSATLKLNNTGTTLMNYKQPSFVGTHTAPIKGWTSPSPYKDNLGPRPIRDFSYYPSKFYKRN
ncbi:RHS repeat-associated core domain-containing protein, partial [Chryseobacterium scophthalmum]|uniref:RHS repeat-associated core domain-containing protein n=1 Tax=Chryseobacterium scophthalmum TaxID=59733 RepID=UPI003D092368